MRVVSLARDTSTGPKTVWELSPVQDFGFRGGNYIMKTVRVVSLARETPVGPPLRSYKYYQNMSKGSKVMERTRMPC